MTHQEEGHVSFTLALDREIYRRDTSGPPAEMDARLTIRSTVSPPLILEFFSEQYYDLVIINDAGQEVYRWSAGRAFPMIASNVPVHREKHWPVQVTLADSHGVALPAGHYIAQSYLMTRTDPGTHDPVAFAKKYAASVHFVIEERQPRPREGVVVESLTVPPGGPQGPVRSTEFSMVGAYDVDWLTDPRYRRLLDNLAASPGAVDKVRVFKCLNSGNRESVPPPAATDTVWPLGQASPSFPRDARGVAHAGRPGGDHQPRIDPIRGARLLPWRGRADADRPADQLCQLADSDYGLSE